MGRPLHTLTRARYPLVWDSYPRGRPFHSLVRACYPLVRGRYPLVSGPYPLVWTLYPLRREPGDRIVGSIPLFPVPRRRVMPETHSIGSHTTWFEEPDLIALRLSGDVSVAESEILAREHLDMA